jgi:hypothetical protein
MDLDRADAGAEDDKATDGENPPPDTEVPDTKPFPDGPNDQDAGQGPEEAEPEGRGPEEGEEGGEGEDAPGVPDPAHEDGDEDMPDAEEQNPEEGPGAGAVEQPGGEPEGPEDDSVPAGTAAGDFVFSFIVVVPRNLVQKMSCFVLFSQHEFGGLPI